MKYFFETYGCQMNKAESASIEQVLLQRGWSSVDTGEIADLVIINTCSVRATAESRIAGRLGKYTSIRKQRKKKGEAFTLVVTGCMAERLKDDLKRDFPVVDYAIGNFQKQHFADIAISIEKENLKNTQNYALKPKPIKDFEAEPVYTFAPYSAEPGAFQAFVPIMHGCNNFCTYCIVPYVRGREVSRNPNEILTEIDELSKQGVKEITVLGQNVNSFMWKDENGDIDFPTLMEKIALRLEETKSPIEWVRFMSSHPKDLSDKLIDVIAEHRVLCRHIHIPVQHGSTKILESMNRKYTREEYLSLVDRIRAKIPKVSLTTDILLGFPGETNDDYEQTLDLVEKVQYEMAYMYYYNPRTGTPACDFPDQVDVEVKKERLAKLIDMQRAIINTMYKERIGRVVRVIAESFSKDSKLELIGRTEEDAHVVFKAGEDVIGSFVNVRLDELHGNTFRGTMI